MTEVDFRHKKSAAALVQALRSDEHAPISAMIEVADRCNETCVHCYQIQGEKGELETDDWRKIMDELADLGVVFLTISGGEATLRRDFFELVEHARSRRFAVKLFTNGLNMTREKAIRLGELAVQEVQISLYSHRADVHDGITCVPGSFDKTVAGARYLVEAGVKVVLKSPMMTVNQAEADEYSEFVTSLGCDFSFDPHLDPREDGDRSPESFRVSDRTFVEAMRTLQAPLSESSPEDGLDASLCGACSGNVHIEANGEIRPCTQLTVPVGHALKDGVAHAWHHNETGRAIRSVTWNDLPSCRRCDLRDYCSRCFSNARHETGDALSPYETACHQAALQYEVSHNEAPLVEIGPDRSDARVGPYRRTSDGVYRSFHHTATAEETERLQRHGWARSVSDLVQIRTEPSNKMGSASRGPTSPRR